MSENTELEALNGADENPYIVVVGEVVGMTDRTLNIRYLGLEGERTVVVDRLKFGPAGSTGVPMGDGLRAFAIKEMTCEVCENNNAGDNKKRSLALELDEDGNENRTYTSCPNCNGRGILTDFGTNTPNIDGEHGDTVSLMEQGELPESSQPIFAFVDGGNRGGITSQWDQPITRLELGAMTPNGDWAVVKTAKTVDRQIVQVADIVQHFNPAYASILKPHGHPIGRPKTGVYATVQHAEIFAPIIENCEEKGLKYHAWGTNRGQDAYCDILLAENGSREDVIANLRKLGVNQSMLSLRENPDAVVKFGIRIHHSFDGALSVSGFAERVACLNGIVSGQSHSLLKAQHKLGVMDKLDFGELAGMICEAALTMWNEMIKVGEMNHIPLDKAAWDSLLALLEQRKILSYPKVGQNGQLTGGRVFRAATQGWDDPTLDWVAVGGDNPDTVGSLNHGMNVITGITSHHVEANDVHGRVTGGQAISVARTEKMLRDTHGVFREVQDSAYAGFVEEMGRQPSNMDELEEWVQFNGVPILNDFAQDQNGNILPELTREIKNDDGQVVQTIRAQLTSTYTPAAN